jgi:hypothetical protein
MIQFQETMNIVLMDVYMIRLVLLDEIYIHGTLCCLYTRCFLYDLSVRIFGIVVEDVRIVILSHVVKFAKLLK